MLKRFPASPGDKGGVGWAGVDLCLFALHFYLTLVTLLF